MFSTTCMIPDPPGNILSFHLWPHNSISGLSTWSPMLRGRPLYNNKKVSKYIHVNTPVQPTTLSSCESALLSLPLPCQPITVWENFPTRRLTFEVVETSCIFVASKNAIDCQDEFLCIVFKKKWSLSPEVETHCRALRFCKKVSEIDNKEVWRNNKNKQQVKRAKSS